MYKTLEIIKFFEGGIDKNLGLCFEWNKKKTESVLVCGKFN